MSIATVFSIVPLDIFEPKRGVYPIDGKPYVLPRPEPGKCTILHVNDAVTYMYVGIDATPDKSGSIKMILSGEKVARAIVEDYINSQLAVDDVSKPGIIWRPGELNKISPEDAKILIDTQTRRFRELVKLADDEWSKHHQHKFITKLQAIAARELGLDRDWANEPKPPKKCPACLTNLDPAAGICYNCKVIVDPEKIKGLAFAK